MAGQTVTFPKGSILFSTASPSRRIYLLRAGQVRLSSDSQAIFDHLQPGCFFSEKSLLGSPPWNQTATALSAVEAVAFNKSELLAKLRQDPAFAAHLVRDFAARMDRYEQTIRDLVSEKADVRLARLLYRSAPASRKSGWVQLPIPFTNLELARMVGTTRWRISHLLNRFQRLGWLRRDDHLSVRREGLRSYLDGQA